MSTPYTNTTLLKKAIHKVIFNNPSNLVEADDIANKIDDVIDYFEANIPSIPVGQPFNTLKYDGSGELIANGSVTQNSYDIITYKNSNNISNISGKEQVILYATTTNATSTPLKLDDILTGIPIPNNTIAKIRIEVVGIQTAGSAGIIGDCTTRVLQGAIKNISGTPASIGGLSTVEIIEDAALSACVLSSNTVPGILNVTVTGQANKTIQWAAYASLTLISI